MPSDLSPPPPTEADLEHIEHLMTLPYAAGGALARAVLYLLHRDHVLGGGEAAVAADREGVGLSPPVPPPSGSRCPACGHDEHLPEHQACSHVVLPAGGSPHFCQCGVRPVTAVPEQVPPASGGAAGGPSEMCSYTQQTAAGQYRCTLYADHKCSHRLGSFHATASDIHLGGAAGGEGEEAGDREMAPDNPDYLIVGRIAEAMAEYGFNRRLEVYALAALVHLRKEGWSDTAAFVRLTTENARNEADLASLSAAHEALRTGVAELRAGLAANGDPVVAGLLSRLLDPPDPA